MTLAILLISLISVQEVSALDTCNVEQFVMEQREQRAVITAEMRRLISQSNEILDQRQEIAVRLLELADGRHRFRGMTDPNYNARSLQARDRALTSQLAIIDQQLAFARRELELLNSEAEVFNMSCSSQRFQ